MVLETIEDSLRSSLGEEQHVAQGTLTIEHVLPQSWEANWPLPLDGAAGLQQSSTASGSCTASAT